MPQNQHIMGWGAGNPEPSPGHYDFADLDRYGKPVAASPPLVILFVSPVYSFPGDCPCV